MCFFEMKFFTLFCVFYFVFLFVAAILFAYMYVMVIAVTMRQPSDVEMKNVKKRITDKCLLAFIYHLNNI